MSSSHINPYDLLGVTPKSTLDEIKKSYYSLALIMHPDKGGSPTEMHILKTAYNWIKEQITPVETNPFKDYESIQQNFDDFIKEQDETKPPPLTTILAESIGFEFTKFTQLYDRILAEYSHNSNYFNNKDYIYSIIHCDIHNRYIRDDKLILTNDRLWEFVEHELTNKWLNKNLCENCIPSSIGHGYGEDMQQSTLTTNYEYNPNNISLDNSIQQKQKEVIIYTEPKDLSEYKEIGLTIDKVPEKLTNYTLDDPLAMTDYNEAFSDMSAINTNLEKSLEHINITENVNILMEKRLAERGDKPLSVLPTILTKKDLLRCKLESELL
jgi:curved DNA-binding protein CbpA